MFRLCMLSTEQAEKDTGLPNSSVCPLPLQRSQVRECQAVTGGWVVVFVYLFHCCVSVNAKLLQSNGLLFLFICSIVLCL